MESATAYIPASEYEDLIKELKENKTDPECRYYRFYPSLIHATKGVKAYRANYLYSAILSTVEYETRKTRDTNDMNTIKEAYSFCKVTTTYKKLTEATGFSLNQVIRYLSLLNKEGLVKSNPAINNNGKWIGLEVKVKFDPEKSDSWIPIPSIAKRKEIGLIEPYVWVVYNEIVGEYLYQLARNQTKDRWFKFSLAEWSEKLSLSWYLLNKALKELQDRKWLKYKTSPTKEGKSVKIRLGMRVVAQHPFVKFLWQNNLIRAIRRLEGIQKILGRYPKNLKGGIQKILKILYRDILYSISLDSTLSKECLLRKHYKVSCETCRDSGFFPKENKTNLTLNHSQPSLPPEADKTETGCREGKRTNRKTNHSYKEEGKNHSYLSPITGTDPSEPAYREEIREKEAYAVKECYSTPSLPRRSQVEEVPPPCPATQVPGNRKGLRMSYQSLQEKLSDKPKLIKRKKIEGSVSPSQSAVKSCRNKKNLRNDLKSSFIKKNVENPLKRKYSKKIFDLVDYWTSIEINKSGLRRSRIGSKTYQSNLEALRGVLSGTHPALSRKFTVEEIKDAMDRFARMALDPNYTPYSLKYKRFLKGLSISEFIWNPYTQMSYLSYLVEHPDEPSSVISDVDEELVKAIKMKWIQDVLGGVKKEFSTQEEVYIRKAAKKLDTTFKSLGMRGIAPVNYWIPKRPASKVKWLFDALKEYYGGIEGVRKKLSLPILTRNYIYSDVLIRHLVSESIYCVDEMDELKALVIDYLRNLNG